MPKKIQAEHTFVGLLKFLVGKSCKHITEKLLLGLLIWLRYSDSASPSAHALDVCVSTMDSLSIKNLPALAFVHFTF